MSAEKCRYGHKVRQVRFPSPLNSNLNLEYRHFGSWGYWQAYRWWLWQEVKAKLNRGCRHLLQFKYPVKSLAHTCREPITWWVKPDRSPTVAVSVFAFDTPVSRLFRRVQIWCKSYWVLLWRWKELLLGNFWENLGKTLCKRARVFPYIEIIWISPQVEFKYYLFVIIFTPAIDFSVLPQGKKSVSSVRPRILTFKSIAWAD